VAGLAAATASRTVAGIAGHASRISPT
jgi:hypothetical protein